MSIISTGTAKANSYLKTHRKAVTAAVGALAVIVLNHTSGSGDVQIDIAAILAAIGVHQIPNAAK